MISSPREKSIFRHIGQISWVVILVILTLTAIGIVMLYSAADGHMHPWATKQMVRLLFGFTIMVGMACVDVRWWLSKAYFLYGIFLILLIVVEIVGFIGKGGQRWIDLYVFHLQPSELMKIALILVLARYFHGLSQEMVKSFRSLLIPTLLIAIPSLLVMRQPDLGTAMIFIFSGITLFFVAGVQIWKFCLVGTLGAASIPILWQFLRDYQKNRILTFLDPERDPFGAGYHITQSKIALGSGGIFGKGFLKGSQSHLNFLPEKQTDFIFTMYCEEFGFVGAIVLIALYSIILLYGLKVSLKSRSHFGRLVAIGMTSTFFFYVFINMAMVMGILPVVGVPLPLVSYGGTAMLTILMGFGILMSVQTHQGVRINRGGMSD
jgi:rod shape determining protein RodA